MDSDDLNLMEHSAELFRGGAHERRPERVSFDVENCSHSISIQAKRPFHAAPRGRTRRRSSVARPYIARLTSLSVAIWHSVCPSDQGPMMAAATALSFAWNSAAKDASRRRRPPKGALHHTVPNAGPPNLPEHLPFRRSPPAMVGSLRRETAMDSRPASSIFLVEIRKRDTTAYAVA